MAKTSISKPMRELLSLHSKFKRLALKRVSKAQIDTLDAMVLATATRSGKPSARVVLLKGTYNDGLVFYTNYKSRKARELEANPHAALVLYYPELGKQVRVEGTIRRVPSAMSEAYWARRPRESQIGGVASPQSEWIASYAELSATARRLSKLFEGQTVPRPKHWGGYVLLPKQIEFWTAGIGRLHQRFAYVKTTRGWAKRWMAP